VFFTRRDGRDDYDSVTGISSSVSSGNKRMSPKRKKTIFMTYKGCEK
jgi:hypothetical protein